MMPEIEDLTMYLTSLFKIPVRVHTLSKASTGSRVYIARRFGRVNSEKIHIEDFCQLSEFLTEYKYKSSYKKAGKLVARYCHKGLDLRTYFEFVLFSYLSCNHDMHLKTYPWFTSTNR